MGKDLDDYLQEGLLGPLENKPDERRKYLGTLRERVIVALTHAQVRELDLYKDEIEKVMKENPETNLFLNANIDYLTLSEYIKIADQLNIPYTMTVNTEYNSEFGLVLAYDYAIDKEEIMLHVNGEKKDSEENKDKGLKRFLDKLF
jgi:uncharacterized protein YueI